MVSGKSKMYIYLEPLEKFVYTYKLLALDTGKIKLPGFLVELLIMEGSDKLLVHDTSNLR